MTLSLPRQAMPGHGVTLRFVDLRGGAGSARPADVATRAGSARRIVIVLHDFSGGGTERVAIRLANAWAAAGRRVTIFCGTEAGCLRELVERAVQVVAALRPCPRSATSRLTLASELADYAASARPDIVFAPGNFHLLVLAAFAARNTSGATTVAKLSNPLARSTGVGRAIKALFLRLVSRRIDCLVAMSPALQDEARQVLRRDDIALAWEPILLAGRPPIPTCGPRRRIVVVGRLEPQKNVALALEAFARSRAATSAELVILGEGSERDLLLHRARQLGIADRVRMPGHCRNVPEVLAGGSLFLITSRYEGYPAVLIEALAAGIPIVATRCSPAIEEILGGDPATTVVDADADAIAAAIDAGLAAAPGRRAGCRDLPRIARHEVDGAAAAYLAVLDAARTGALRKVAGRQ